MNGSHSVVRAIAEAADKHTVLSAMPNIEGLVPVVHSAGYGMSGANEGHAALMRAPQRRCRS